MKERTEHYYIRRRGIVTNLLGWKHGTLPILYVCEYLLRSKGRITQSDVWEESVHMHIYKVVENLNVLVSCDILEKIQEGRRVFYKKGKKMDGYLEEIDSILYI